MNCRVDWFYGLHDLKPAVMNAHGELQFYCDTIGYDLAISIVNAYNRGVSLGEVYSVLPLELLAEINCPGE